MIKMIALDIDGTLLNSEHQISKRTHDYLISQQENNTSIVLASGRDISSLKEIGNRINMSLYKQNYFICLNGLEIYDYQGNLLKKNKRLTQKEAHHLNEIGNKYKLDVVYFFKDSIYILEHGHTGIMEYHFLTTTRHFIQDFKEIPSSLFDDLRKVAYLQSVPHMNKCLPFLKEETINHYDLCQVEPDWIEINPYGVNKGSALQQLSELSSISTQDIIAFGNGENDIPMLKAAGKGIAMKNSFETVIRQADDVCLSNDEDGIVEYLKKEESHV